MERIKGTDCLFRGAVITYATMVSTTTVPTIALPAILFPGQELKIFLNNTSGAGWASISLSSVAALAITNVNLPTIGDTEYGSISFVALDVVVNNTYAWTYMWSGN